MHWTQCHVEILYGLINDATDTITFKAYQSISESTMRPRIHYARVFDLSPCGACPPASAYLWYVVLAALSTGFRAAFAMGFLRQQTGTPSGSLNPGGANRRKLFRGCGYFLLQITSPSSLITSMGKLLYQSSMTSASFSGGTPSVNTFSTFSERTLNLSYGASGSMSSLSLSYALKNEAQTLFPSLSKQITFAPRWSSRYPCNAKVVVSSPL